MMDGLGLICPGLFPVVDPSWLQKVRIALARVYYRYRHFPIPLNEPELFTATPRWLDFLRADALSLHRATAALLVTSKQMDWFVRNAPEKISMPLLLMLAGKDRILNNARTKAYFERFASENKRLIEYPGANHTLEFEPDPEPFISDLTGWIGEVSSRVELPRSGV
jgi:alpha-beta hydrolase superfamily lysophospholipase